MTNKGNPGQVAAGEGIAQASASPGGTASATVNIGLTPEQVRETALAIVREEHKYNATIESLSTRLDTTQEAVRGFFNILNDNDVPLEKLPQTLGEIALRYRDMLQRLSALAPEDPLAKAKIDESRTILTRADSAAAYNQADALLADAEASQLEGIWQAEALEREAQEAVGRKRRDAAATRERRGELSLTRMNFIEAAEHFRAAAALASDDMTELRERYVDRGRFALRWSPVAARCRNSRK